MVEHVFYVYEVVLYNVSFGSHNIMTLCSLCIPTFSKLILTKHKTMLCCRIGDYHHVFSYTLDPSDTSSVTSLLYLSQQNRVAVGLSNGRIFLVRSDASPSAPTMGEGSFVMSELGSSTVLHAIAAVYRDEGR